MATTRQRGSAEMDDAWQKALNGIRGMAIDFDNHFYEPEDCYTRHIEPKYRDLAIEMKGSIGSRAWTMGDREGTFTPPGLHTDFFLASGALQGVFTGKDDAADVPTLLMQGLENVEDHPDWRDRAARLKVMDEQGLQTIVVLPSSGIILHHDFVDRPDALTANLRSFNRWMEEDWTYGGEDKRVFAIPMLSLVDLDWAVEELERVVSLGSKFILIPHTPYHGKSPADPFFDPFWRRVEEMEVKLVFHIGYEGFTHFYGTVWGEQHTYVSGFSALQHYLGFGERPICDAIAALILHNLFGRFPGIELLTIENGSAWVGPLLRSLDKAAKFGRNGRWLGGPLADLPSDVFRNHVYVNPFHEEDIAGLVDLIGAERVLFGSDYPHPEGLAEPFDYADRLVTEVSEQDFRKIMRDNAASLLGI